MLAPLPLPDSRKETFPALDAYYRAKRSRMARNQRTSLVFPILLIALGAILLYTQYHPAWELERSSGKTRNRCAYPSSLAPDR